MRKLTLIALLLVLVTACGHKDKGFVPDRLLNEKEMIDIMTDVQIIEADINYKKSQDREQGQPQKDYSQMARSYYDQLFEHYDITDSIFTQNIRYYTERPEVLEKIMDSVMQRLMKEQTNPSLP